MTKREEESEHLLERTKGLLEAGRDPTSLLRSVVHEEDALESILFLVEKGASFDVAQGGVDPSMALYKACKRGDLRTVEYLLTNEQIHVDVNKQDGGETPLHLACRLDSLEIARRLVTHASIDIDASSCCGCDTPLHVASQRQNPEIVRFLLENHANVHATNRLGNTPLHCVCYYCSDSDSNRSIDMIERMLENDANINAVSLDGETPICRACWYGNKSVVRFLLQRGADVAIGKSPLYVATAMGHFQIAELLLENGALLNDPQLENDWKTIQFRAKHDLDTAGPLMERIKREPRLQGRLHLNLVGFHGFPWNETIQSYSQILLSTELQELHLYFYHFNLGLVKPLLPMMKNSSIRSFAVITEDNMQLTPRDSPDKDKEVCACLCELLESNNQIRKIMFDLGINICWGKGHGFALRVMQSLAGNTSVVAFSALSLIPKVVYDKGIITQNDVDCACLRNKAMPLMEARHDQLWPHILHRIGSKTSPATEWGASAIFALIRKAVPALASPLNVLGVESKRLYIKLP